MPPIQFFKLIVNVILPVQEHRPRFFYFHLNNAGVVLRTTLNGNLSVQKPLVF